MKNLLLILLITVTFYTNAQNVSQFDSLYKYCIEHKSDNKTETLENFEKLKVILKNDTNKLHKAKLYFLNFILKQISKDYNYQVNILDSNTIYVTDSIDDISKLINISKSLTARGNTKKSISLLNKAITVCKDKDSLNYISIININLAEAYRKDFEYDKAIYLLNKVIKDKKIKKINLTYAYGRLSANYSEHKTCNFENCKDSVEKYSLLSLKTASEINDTNLIASSQNELGYFYLKKKIDYKKSYFYLTRALDNYKRINSQEGYLSVLINLSNLYLITNRNKKAIEIISKGTDFYTFNTSENTCMRFFLQLANVYAHNNKFYYAYEYLSLGRKMQETLFKDKIKTNSLEFIAKYDLKLKEAEINQMKQQEIKTNQEKLFISIVLFLVIVILTFILFNNKLKNRLQRQKEANLELENKNLIKKNEYEQRELSYAMANLVKQNNVLKEIKNLLKNKEVDKAIKTINVNTNIESDLHLFLNKFTELYPDFFEKLEKKHPNITKSEKYLSALLLMNLKSQEVADILCVALSTIHKNRQRLRKKLNLPKNSDIAQYLKTLIKE